MKKILSMLMAMILLTGLLSSTAFAAGKENLCKTFQSSVGVAVSGYFGTELDGLEEEQYTYEKVPGDILFIRYVQSRMEQDGSLKQYGYIVEDPYAPEGHVRYNYNIPFEVFEAKAKSIANYSGDLKLERCYDSASDCMQLSDDFAGIDQGHPAFVIGYTENGDNRYTVYVQRMQLGFPTVEEVEEEFFDYYEDYDPKKDIFVDYDGEYHLVHRNIFYIAEIKYENGAVFYQSVKSAKSLDGISMITRDTVINKDTSINMDKDGCSIKAENGVFPAGTAITVEKLTDGDIFKLAQKSLKNIASKMTVFEITAKNNNTAVQPNGKVAVTFTIPDGYDMDKLDLYFVATDGKTEKLKSSVAKATKTITTELSHFSTYVLVENEKSTPASAASQDIPPTGDTSNIILWSLLALTSCAIIVAQSVLRKKKITY